MIEPVGLVINGDKILISNSKFLCTLNQYFLVYQLNGFFVSKIEKYGRGEVEFNDSRGIACNESNGDIYICDYGNNRIQILSKEKFKFQFGAFKLKPSS